MPPGKIQNYLEIIYYIFIPILALSFLLLSFSEGKTVSTIEDKNSFDVIEETKTLQETNTKDAKAHGYRPCKVCKPPG